MALLLNILKVHLISRKRKNVRSTICEILLPIFFFFILFCMKKYIEDSAKGESYHYTEPSSQKEIFLYAPMKLFYSPKNNNFINNLINKVSEKLDILPSDIEGYNNESALLLENEINLVYRQDYVAVIFETFNETSEYKPLTYTIRSSEKYLTSMAFPIQYVPGPHEKNGMIYERFVSLQIAIAKAYDELMTSHINIGEIAIQSFPYPPYNRDEGWSIKYNVLLPFVTINSTLFLVLFIIGRLAAERLSGIKELIKMMGLKQYPFWISHYINLIIPQIFVIVFIVFFTKFENSLIPQTFFVILSITFFLYISYIILLGFLISLLFTETTLANLVTIVLWSLSQLAHLIKFDGYNYVCFFIPNVEIFQLFNIIGILEYKGTGLQFDNMFVSIKNVPASNYGIILLIMLLKNIIFAVFVILIEKLLGKYANLDCSWCNLLPSFWKTSCLPSAEHNEMEAIMDTKTYFEEEPRNADVEISIKNVSKIYRSQDGFDKSALRDVSLDIYKSGITVLLGHNGAGKTTLMSIIAGMQRSTQGSISVGGYNPSTEKSKVHKIIGLCPQHNLAFADLTIREQLIFFAKIRGLNDTEAINECDSNMKKLNLEDKSNQLCSNISGGTQRRLQLAIALAGHSKILILDEPTSGLDPKNRRMIWDILMELRKDHTILLTTHFMEEADFLGDRIAILDNGSLLCYGTSLFLKSVIYPGYKLRVIKNDCVKSTPVLVEIKKNVPTQTNFETDKEIQMSVHPKSSDDLLKITNNLESAKLNSVISAFSFSPPTMEDVFLKIFSTSLEYEGVMNDSDNDPFDKINLSTFGSRLDVETNNHSQPNFCTRQYKLLKALIKKKLIYHQRNIFLWLPQLVFLIFGILIASSLYQCEISDKLSSTPKVKIDTSLYRKPLLHVLYSTSDENLNITNFLKIEGLKFEHVNNAYEAILQMGEQNINDYMNSLLFGYHFGEYETTVFYSTSVYHALPTAINVLMNIMTSQALNSSYRPYISVFNHPIKGSPDSNELNSNVKSDDAIILWGMIITLAFKFFTIIFLPFPIYEITSGMKEQQLLTGLNKITYWLSYFIPDFLFCLLVYTCTFWIFLLESRTYNTILFETLGPITALTILYVLAMLLCIYLMSKFFRNITGGIVYFSVISILDCAVSLLFYIQNILNPSNAYLDILYFIIGLFPMIHFDYGFLNIGYVARSRAACLEQHLKMLTKMNITYSNEIRCEKDEVTNEWSGLLDYYTDPKFGIQKNLVWLSILIFIYIVCLFLFNEKNKCKNVISNVLKRTQNNVIDEENRGIIHPLDVEGISKTYQKTWSLKRNKTEALKRLSFNIQKGEIFGLLGLNGAGKTTTFKILTKNIQPDEGNILLSGENFDEKTLKVLSYCPQFDVLGDYLTGWEVLELYCKLRSVPDGEIKQNIDNMLNSLGIYKLRNIRTSHYSGGSKRKLSLGAALIGFIKNKNSSKVILLDEPTTGVDPFSRRLLHKVIRHAAQKECSILISSHNMDEVDTLCGRIGILSKGTLNSVSNVLEFIENNRLGYSLTIKLKSGIEVSKDTVDSRNGGEDTQDEITKMKQEICDVFECDLKDLHESILQYHVGKEYSYLITEMEKLKEKYKNTIERYIISESKLEEAFLLAIENENKD